MNKLKCKICGGQIEVQGDDRGICTNCGTAYSLDSMRKMFDGIKVSVTGSNEDVQQWHHLLDRYYTSCDFQEAERIAKKILEAAPYDEKANSMYDELQVLKYFEVKNGVIKSYSGTARKIVIPSFVTEIEAETFADNQYIEEVVLPDSLTIIEESLFANCKNLKKVFIPNGIIGIGKSAFTGCSTLTDVNIPNSIICMGENAFSECSALNHIELPKELESIECYTFVNCTSLTEIKLSEGLKSIGVAAFMKCTSLTDIKLPKKLEVIEANTFSGCSSLTKIEWPDRLNKIGHSAFKDCVSLTKIELPNGLETIENAAFNGCVLLSELKIPDSVTKIGIGVAWDLSIVNSCNNLKNVYYPRIFYNNTRYILHGTKLYDLMEDRKKNRCCMNCGRKLSFWMKECKMCDTCNDINGYVHIYADNIINE